MVEQYLIDDCSPEIQEYIESLRNQIKSILNLCEKNEKRRSSGLVGCDEIRKVLKVGK